MSKLYQIKHKQFDAANEKLKQLELVYQDINKKLLYPLNPMDIVGLKRQQADLDIEMEELASWLDQLGKELQNLKQKDLSGSFPQYIDELSSILVSVEFTHLINIFSSILGSGYRSVPDNLETMLLVMDDIPGDKDNLRPLLKFVSLLIQDTSLTEEIRRSLKSWIEAQETSMPTLKDNSNPIQPGVMENYLMLKLQPHPPEGFVIDAALIRDPSPYDIEDHGVITPLKLDNQVVKDSKDLNVGLQQVLCELITTCTRDYKVPLTDLTIQWFLPIELMSLPVEQWGIPMGRKQKPAIGKRCKAILIRSYDRHFSNDYDISMGDWEKYWNSLLNSLDLNSHQVLDALDPLAGVTNMSWHNPQILGCRFLEHDNQQKQEDLWDSLLSQGVSIALWMRYLTCAQQDYETIFNQVAQGTISNLPTTLTHHRKSILPDHTDDLFSADPNVAAYLSLLWDNPFRRFPHIDFSSESA